jgi:hypothetical protein
VPVLNQGLGLPNQGKPKPLFIWRNKMSDGGKGSKPRPYSVSNEEYANRWDAIFAKKDPDSETDKTTRNNEETQQVQNLSLDSSGKSLL